MAVFLSSRMIARSFRITATKGVIAHGSKITARSGFIGLKSQLSTIAATF